MNHHMTTRLDICSSLETNDGLQYNNSSVVKCGTLTILRTIQQQLINSWPRSERLIVGQEMKIVSLAIHRLQRNNKQL